MLLAYSWPAGLRRRKPGHFVDALYTLALCTLSGILRALIESRHRRSDLIASVDLSLVFPSSCALVFLLSAGVISSFCLCHTCGMETGGPGRSHRDGVPRAAPHCHAASPLYAPEIKLVLHDTKPLPDLVGTCVMTVHCLVLGCCALTRNCCLMCYARPEEHLSMCRTDVSACELAIVLHTGLSCDLGDCNTARTLFLHRPPFPHAFPSPPHFSANIRTRVR